MKANINKLTIIIVLLLAFPSIVFATSDAVVDGNPSKGVTKPGVCEPGWTCMAYTGAVRFTYVDQNGNALSDSYDFVTYDNQVHSTFKFMYNALTGNKSKLNGGFEFKTASYDNFPTLSGLVGRYNWYLDHYFPKGKRSNLPTSGNTGGWANNGWSKEREWFKSLTAAGLKDEEYQANVQAFGLALQDTPGYKFDADAMKIKLQEGCMKGEEIFIQMEPMFAIYSYNREFIYGTLRDIIQYYHYGASFTNAQITGMFNYINNKGFPWTIYYGTKINAPSWNGYQPSSSSSGYKVDSYAAKDAKVGYAVGLDWINDSRNGCTACKFEDGEFYYDDEKIVYPSDYTAGFTNLYHYVFSKASAGGKDCCNAVKTEIEAGKTISSEVKKYYDSYCNSDILCEYKDGDFYLNDEKIVYPSDYTAGFTSLYQYAMSPKDKGGLDCCDTVKDAISAGKKIDSELKEYYNLYCDNGNKCKYVDGEFYYEDKKVTYPSDYTAGFKNLYHYVMAPATEGGLDCCDTVKEQLAKGTKVDSNLKKYYDFYCDTPDNGKPCSLKTFDTIDKVIHYCEDGKKCSEEEYNKRCKKPNCDPDPDPDPDNNCCTLDAIEPGWIGGTINNCCADGGISEAHEYDLDDLFCKNESLGIENYDHKCGTDIYVDQDAKTELDEEYCKMYCTERVSVEIPGAITAVSGRYFKLTETSKGTKSSYIEGYKRCRLIIEYDAWEQKYFEMVEDEVDAYNEFQEHKAYELLYEEAEKNKVANQKDISKICCECSVEYNDTCYKDGKATECKKKATKTVEDTCEIKYNKYVFKKMLGIYPIQIDYTKRDNCKNIFEAIELIKDTAYKTSHISWSAWEIDDSIKACDEKMASMEKEVETGHGKCTLKCEREITEAELRREDVHTKKKEYADKAKLDNDRFNSSADLAKDLEETIEKCDKYFTEYKGSKANESYKFNATQKFSYTQIYLDDDKELKLDEIFIDFEEVPGCEIDPVVVTGEDLEDGLRADQYSNKKYGSGTEKMTDLKRGDLAYESTATGFKKYNDETYVASKKFTSDAKYHVTCKWDEGVNTLYTLVPNGHASDVELVENFTVHEQEYKVYLTTLTGTYETHWDIKGLGTPRPGETAGRFDAFFLKGEDVPDPGESLPASSSPTKGKVCSGRNPSEGSMLSCELKISYETVLTGYCNVDPNDYATYDPETCDPYESGYRLFNFKVVDPKILFPSGTNTVDGDIAYNWTSTEAGKNAMKDIETTAANGQTFHPDKLTYSYILTPQDMAHVKEYNAQQVYNADNKEASGGYTDFTLVCSKETCDKGACAECKSPFLENLANGKVQLTGKSYNASGWSNPYKDLTQVRKDYGWK